MAEKGEITNGDQSPGYSVFEVGEGTVTAQYRAPDDCGITSDNIYVYSTCETDDEPREIYHNNLVGEEDIDIKCDREWSGTMTIEKLERFDCELEKSTDDSWGHTTLHELSTTRATVSIQAENIDDSPPGFNINMGENLIVSGFMKCEYNNTEIIDGRKSGSNPSTSHHKETLVGEDLFDLTHKNLNLMFTSVMGDEQSEQSLEELAKMLESGEWIRLNWKLLERTSKHRWVLVKVESRRSLFS